MWWFLVGLFWVLLVFFDPSGAVWVVGGGIIGTVIAVFRELRRPQPPPPPISSPRSS